MNEFNMNEPTITVTMTEKWTGDKFVQELFYNIFEKLNLDYSLDIARNIMFIKPKCHKVRDFDRKINFFADAICGNEEEKCE